HRLPVLSRQHARFYPGVLFYVVEPGMWFEGDRPHHRHQTIQGRKHCVTERRRRRLYRAEFINDDQLFLCHRLGDGWYTNLLQAYQVNTVATVTHRAADALMCQ